MTKGFKIDNGVLVKYTGRSADIVIPSDVTIIGGGWHEGAFEYCSKIKSVVISEGVLEIGQEAFCECINLTDVCIPTSMKKIGWRAFYRCDKLHSFVVNVSYPVGGRIQFSSDYEAATKCIALFASHQTLSDEVYIEGIRKGILNKKRLSNIALMRLLDKGDVPDEDALTLYTDCVKYNRLVLAEAAIRSMDELTLNNLVALGMLDIKSYSKTMDKVIQDKDAEISAFALAQREQLFGKDEVDEYREKVAAKETELSGRQLRPEKSEQKPAKPSVAEDKKQWFIKDWNDGTLGIYGYKGNDNEITIPAQFGRKRVTTLFRSDNHPLYRYFARNVALTKVIISEGIERIEKNTFEWWYNPGLTEIVIPASVVVIEEQDFRFPEDVTIYGMPGSCAEKYAAEHGISFVIKTE